MSSLYELTVQYRQIATADGDAEMEALLAELDGAIRDKATNIAMVIRNAESLAEAIRKEEMRLAYRRKAIDGQITRLQEYVLTGMLASGIDLIECPLFRIKVRENPDRVVIESGAAIPAEYMRPPPPAEPDKAKLRDDLRQGVVIDGVRLERGHRLEIK